MPLIAAQVCGMAKNIEMILRIITGRITAISGSRPTMMVSV
jgi:hypothetical protein